MASTHETAQTPTLTETLASIGFTHRRAADVETTGRHDVFDEDGNLVASLTAHEAWDWLRAGAQRRASVKNHSAP